MFKVNSFMCLKMCEKHLTLYGVRTIKLMNLIVNPTFTARQNYFIKVRQQFNDEDTFLSYLFYIQPDYNIEITLCQVAKWRLNIVYTILKYNKCSILL